MLLCCWDWGWVLLLLWWLSLHRLQPLSPRVALLRERACNPGCVRTHQQRAVVLPSWLFANGQRQLTQPITANVVLPMPKAGLCPINPR